MKNENKHSILGDLEWVLSGNLRNVAWPKAVMALLGHPEWARTEGDQRPLREAALREFSDILRPGEGPWELSATREGWIEIAKRTAGVEAVVDWLLKQEE